MKAAAIAALLVALLAPVSAAAAVVPEVERAYRIAEAHWGGPPPCGEVRLTFRSWRWLMRTAGWGTVAFATHETCSIDIQRGLTPIYLCVILAHELGHLHGRGHEPEGLMRAFSPDERTVPACMGARIRKGLAFRAQRVRREARPGL